MISSKMLKLVRRFEKLAMEAEEELDFEEPKSRGILEDFEGFEGFESEEQSQFDPGNTWAGGVSEYDSESLLRNLEEVANAIQNSEEMIRDSGYDNNDYRSGLTAVLSILKSMKKALLVGLGGRKSNTMQATGIDKKMDDLISSVERGINI